MNQTFTAISYDGLNTDSLGNYLAGLGLLAATTQRWPAIRGCWRRERFVILAPNEVTDLDLRTFLLKDWKPTSYERWWTAFQKVDTKAKSSANVCRERSQRSTAEVRLLDAHIVGIGRNCFNPVLGTGGNVGKRDLAKACKDAANLLPKPESSDWLGATLTGRTSISLPDLSNGGTWFVFANKTFNSGQAWYRDGKLSPWSLLLAMEGASCWLAVSIADWGHVLGLLPCFHLFRTHPSRKPMVRSAWPVASSRAPLWDYPATLVEVRSLFQAGWRSSAVVPRRRRTSSQWRPRAPVLMPVFRHSPDSTYGKPHPRKFMKPFRATDYPSASPQKIPPGKYGPRTIHFGVVDTLDR